jgi:hypothetical protein
MRITNWQIREFPGGVEISADIDDFRLWYKIPEGIPVSRTGDPFLAAALLPAMAKGEPLVVEPGLTVSPVLMRNLARLQEIHHCWNPALKIVPVTAAAAPAPAARAGAISFFSGGVDAMFTFLRNPDAIDHAVFIHGFDFFADRDSYRKAVDRNASFVERFGKSLIPVETSFYPFGYRHNLSRVLTQGSTLASVALLLGFSRAFIPSSDHFSYLRPSGTHPLTDPLYSNESVTIIHDSADARRIDKVIRVAGSEPALAALTVCSEDMNANCGRCTKCLRTMIPLHLMGATSAPFPWPLRADAIRRADWSKEPIMFGQNMDFALLKGDRQLLGVLAAIRRKNERILLLKEIDRVLLGGMVKKAFRFFSRNAPAARRIDVLPPKD